MSRFQIPELFVLCSRPSNFGVPEISDNAFQDAGREILQANPERKMAELMAEWERVYKGLVSRGAHMMEIPPVHGLFDQSYATDPATPITSWNQECGAYIPAYHYASQMASQNRQKEVNLAVKALKQHGFVNPAENDGYCHEGGDLHYLPGHDFFTRAVGPRSQVGSGFLDCHVLKQLVVEIPLHVTPTSESQGLFSQATKGYHGDCLYWPLPDKHLIACYERMTEPAKAFFSALYPPSCREEISGDEADLMVTNGLAVPDPNYARRHVLFMPDKTPQRVVDRVQSWGFGIEGYDFELPKMGGGGWKCMFGFALRQNAHDPIPLSSDENDWSWPVGLPLLPPDIRAQIKCYSPRTIRKNPRAAVA